ncbi:MAG: hypothetical protein QXZ11_03215 [Thermoproteota archaeon]
MSLDERTSGSGGASPAGAGEAGESRQPLKIIVVLRDGKEVEVDLADQNVDLLRLTSIRLHLCVKTTRGYAYVHLDRIEKLKRLLQRKCRYLPLIYSDQPFVLYGSGLHYNEFRPEHFEGVSASE